MKITVPKTFYITHQDGKIRTRATNIYFSPSAHKLEGRIAAEDRYPDMVVIEFRQGSYIANDPDIAEFLSLYTYGGIYHEGKADQRFIIGNSMAFIITEEDPTNKVVTKTVTQIEVQEKNVITKDFASKLDVKMLEQYAISQGVDLTNVQMTKNAITAKLIDEWFVK